MRQAAPTRRKGYLFWLALGTAVMGLAMAALLVFELAQQGAIESKREERTDSFSALTFNLELEFLRLQATFDAAVHRPIAPDTDTLQLRYDIFVSRINLLRDNPTVRVLTATPEYQRLMPKLDALVKHADAVLGSQPIERGELQHVLDQLDAMELDIRTFRLASAKMVTHLLEDQSESMLEQNRLIVGLTMMQLILLVLAFVVLSLRHRRNEAQRLGIERELEERVKQRTAELRDSNAALETTLHDLRTAQTQLIQSEKLATLGQLVASVAHEINTPIGAVKSSGKTIADALQHIIAPLPLLFQELDAPARLLFMDLITHVHEPVAIMNSREERAVVRNLAQQLEDAGLEDARNKADVMVQLRAHARAMHFLPLLRHAQSARILEVASQIATVVNSTDNINLAVERVTKIVFALKSFSRTDHSGEFKPTDLAEGLDTVLTIYQHQIRNGVELVRQYDPLPSVLCLPDEINQVWTNLVHNALQAMKQPGVLTLGIHQRGEEAVVTIADTGEGIPDAIRSKIFDPFFTTKPVGEGSGLGLDIVRKIVEKHSGRIEVASVVGEGTTFSVFLPLQPVAVTQIH